MEKYYIGKDYEDGESRFYFMYMIKHRKNNFEKIVDKTQDV